MSKIVASSGNVFEDIGFDATEAANLKLRADLMVQVRSVIEERGLTQMEAARLFAVSQPRISDIVRGKIHGFTIDALVTMLSRGGVRTRVVTDRRDHREPVVQLHNLERELSNFWARISAAECAAWTELIDSSPGRNRRVEEATSATQHAAASDYALCA
jgi:predicted XRE-type DNA-binding protein